MKDTREKNRDHELNLKKSYFFKLRTTISNGELTNINFKLRTTYFESKTQAAPMLQNALFIICKIFVDSIASFVL